MIPRRSLACALAATPALLILNACGGGGGGGAATPVSADAALAAAIRRDARLTTVRQKAKLLLSGSLTAGSSYPAVFIRDLNTFIEPAIDAQGPGAIRAALELFLAHQDTDGNIPDAVVLADNSSFKGTAETDQESSLVQAVAKYIAATGDVAFLSQQVAGVAVISRLESALTFVMTQRFSSQYSLVWGATRADWGDVQPEDVPGGNFDELSHPSISIYDNAMLSLALADLQSLEAAAGRDATSWATRRAALRSAVRAHLWTGTQFMPHLYLEKGSPFPASFDESRIYFQGGTAVAIQAGLLEEPEVLQTFARMVQNKIDSGSGSVGVSLYPSYPAGFFANTEYMGAEYFYQNGGDWPWFGGRIVQQMVVHGQVAQAYAELGPMLDRVIRDNGFYEWYTREGSPRGSAEYRGSAGVIAKAIDLLLAWSASH